ncbi:hypothetical protein PSENEW3_00004209 [Picochlorum sp. SENEW3]|nr:hypothetical protein PSENEW3_00004209 [Picochlorum sp. SENEW3]
MQKRRPAGLLTRLRNAIDCLAIATGLALILQRFVREKRTSRVCTSARVTSQSTKSNHRLTYPGVQ